VGSILIGPTTFNHQCYARYRRLLLQSDLDHYLVQLFVAGSLHGDCEGWEISVSPGDICVFDLGRTFTSCVTTGSTISVILPRASVDRAAKGKNLHGATLKAGTPVTRLLTDFLISLSEASADMELEDTLAIEESAVALLVAGLTRHRPSSAIDSPALTRILRQRVLEFIEANLSRPELGPAELIRRFHVSRSHLYRMFVNEGGVAKIIRDKRLDAAYRALTGLEGSAHSVTEVAYDWGFTSSTQFLRVFRARFNLTPTDARQEGRTLALANSGMSNLQARFAEMAQRISSRD